MKTDLYGIKAIFFDAGGTLLDLDSSRICNLLGAEMGIELALDKFQRAQCEAMFAVGQLVASGAGSTERLKREFYSTLLPQVGVSQERLSAAVQCILKLAESEMLWRKTSDSIPQALAELRRRGLKLGVVSNSDGRIEIAFKHVSLTDYFDFFIDSFVVGVEKPDPAIFHFALERASVEAQEAAYVGDLYYVDVVGARNAGLIPILYDPYQLNPDADCIRISAISDLLALTGH